MGGLETALEGTRGLIDGIECWLAACLVKIFATVGGVLREEETNLQGFNVVDKGYDD